MPVNFLSRILRIGSPIGRGDAHGAAPNPGEREPAERLLASLTSRVPAELLPTFQDAVRALNEPPTTGPALLDAIDRMHVGLGVSIGRGATGEDQRYTQLGQVVSWLYEELGRPQETQYASARRAAQALAASEKRCGDT